MTKQNIIKAEVTATVRGADLLKAVRFAGQCVPRRNMIPILSSVLLRFGHGRLTVIGTDLDVEGEMSVDAECQVPFSFCANPVTLHAVASTGHDVSIAMGETQQGRVLTINAGDISARLNALFPAEDFPLMSIKPEEITNAADIPEGVLAKALMDSRFCISTEETRYYLNGVYLHAKEAGTMIAVATDGHKLYRLITDVPFAGLDGIIFTKAVSIIANALSRSGNRTIIVSGGARWRIVQPSGGGWVIRHKLIDGTFPDYTRVIPVPSEKISLPVSWEQMRRAQFLSIGRSGNFSNGIEFDPEAGVATTINHDLGLRMTVKMPDGKGPRFGINGRYVAEILRRCGTARITGSGPGDPLRFITEDADVTIVVMPMRV